MSSPIATLMSGAQAGDPAAVEALFTALYAELHQLAASHLRRQSPEFTLGTTTLLHEAYLQIASREGVTFPDRPRFFAYASRVMRGMVIDRVRSRQALKRGGTFEFTTLSGVAEVAGGVSATQLDALSTAMDELSRVDAALAELVDLHFFCGFSFAEIAALRTMSERTVQRDWRKARLLLAAAAAPFDGPSVSEAAERNAHG
ncbi:MAG: sigma-70 family RNA polymerase sigma factor [Gemmatimonadaceae bacterium]|nr:sigma-70 family RNA polymerase sigma factor [Gemmatimonadaceae bacterium]